jgi:hypothetical protein
LPPDSQSPQPAHPHAGAQQSSQPRKSMPGKSQESELSAPSFRQFT